MYPSKQKFSPWFDGLPWPKPYTPDWVQDFGPGPFEALAKPVVEVITVIVVAADGQIHSYKGPGTGLKKWLAKLRKAGVNVGMNDLP